MSISKVAAGVWRAGTRYVNWYLVDGGRDGVTVVDGGLPGYRRQLDPALAAIGRTRNDVRAIVLTHGHIDHIGLAAAVAAGGGRVHLHPADAALAADPSTNTTERSVARYLVYPAVLGFVGHCLREGARTPPPFPSSMPLADGEVVDVPGDPVVTHVPGHTAGSCSLEFRDHGVAFVGDAVCTVSPVTGRPAAPQVQTRGSNLNSGDALASLEQLTGITARTILPGHGRVWRDGIEAAIVSARRIGCR